MGINSASTERLRGAPGSAACDRRRRRAAARGRGGRLRELRHSLRPGLGRAALARADARLRSGDRAHPASAARGCSAWCSPRSDRRRRAEITVALGFLALSACGWVIYRLGSIWFGRARRGARRAALPHARARALLRRARLRRYPLPAARARRAAAGGRARAAEHRPAGAPVLALLALAGLLRPEAWAFSALYWLYLMGSAGAPAAREARAERPQRARGELVRLALLAAAAPLVWVLSDLLVTGDPLWSLTNTRHTASDARTRDGHRERARVHPQADRRDPAPAGAGGRGARRRALAAVAARARAARAPPRACSQWSCSRPSPPWGCRSTRATRSWRRRSCASSAAPACSAGCACERGDPRRRVVDGVRRRSCSLALVAYAPAQYRSAHRELTELARQQSIEGDLLALVANHAINLRCGPVGVPNHAPIPLLALYLKTSPANVRQPAGRPHRRRGVYVDPASSEVEDDYVLDPRDPHEAVSVPPGFTADGRQPLVADLPALPSRRMQRTVHPPSRLRAPAPAAAHGSGPGAPAAPAGDRLRLLPSGPDLVRKPTPRGTRTIDAPSDGATGAEPLGGEFSPARADCGFRAPLPPRLARSTADPNAPARLRSPVGCATVTYSNASSPPSRSPRHPALAALGVAVLIAGCGPAARAARSPSATRTPPTARSSKPDRRARKRAKPRRPPRRPPAVRSRKSRR